MGISKGEITGRKNSPGRENNVGKGAAEESGPGAWHRREKKVHLVHTESGSGWKRGKMKPGRVGVYPFWIGLESFR